MIPPLAVIALGAVGVALLLNGKRKAPSSTRRDTIQAPPREPQEAAVGMPGTETDSLAALYPPFATRLQRALAELALEGIPFKVMRTARSLERQAHYRQHGWSTVSRSYHTVTAADGSPEALAADVVPIGIDLEAPLDHPDTAKAARAFRRLLEVCRKHGLRTGGEWEPDGGKWSRFGLGWDPGHIQPAPWGGSIDSAHDQGRRPWTS